MASVYPGAFDAFSNPLPTDKRTNHAAQHGNVNDAVAAIQAVLGLSPAGGSGTVSARIGVVEGGVLSRVSGPGSSTDNALVRFDGTDGKTVQNSGITVDDSNNVTGLGTVASGAVTSSAAVQAAAGSGFVVGSSGPKIMSGTGSPESVVTAPVGSTWIDTAATTGAIKWVKASGTGNTGWVVEYGDTGRRNIVSLATVNATATYSVIHVRRVGQVVHLALEIANSVTNTAHEFLASLPAGFKPATGVTFGGGRSTTALASTAQVSVSAAGQSYMHADTASYVYAAATWLTNDAWPAVLPGA